MFPGFEQAIPDQRHIENKKRSFFQRLARLFVSKEEERELEQNSALMERFDESLLRGAQEEQDKTVDTLVDALGCAHSFDEVFDAVGSAYDNLAPAKAAGLLCELRYAASQIGAQPSRQKRGRRGR